MFPFRRRDPLPGEPGFKREAAKELIQSAKTYVREGKEIYKNAQDEAYSARNDADRALGSYTTFCRDTLQKLNSKLRPVIAEFKSIDVDSRVTVTNPGSSIDLIDGFLSSVSDASLHAVKFPNISGIVDFPNPLSDFLIAFLRSINTKRRKSNVRVPVLIGMKCEWLGRNFVPIEIKCDTYVQFWSRIKSKSRS